VILLWGLPGDGPIAAVNEALLRRGCRVAVIDQHLVLQTEVTLEVGESVEGSLRWNGQEVNLRAVTATYLRPYDSRRLPEVVREGPASEGWHHALAVEDALLCWAELAPIRVVNRPQAMASNASKPLQSTLVAPFGFDVPETLVTTDPKAALEFFEEHRRVIYKSVSGTRSIVAQLSLAEVARLDDVVWCPTQFQRYIEGADYRVHVIGDDVFACRIEAACDDYRYAGRSGASIEIDACRLPADVEERCRKVTAAMGLDFSGIDLRLSPDGRWFCFEVNPCPGFTYYQHATGQPIDDAVASLLARA
jgi:ribosomal protein S6-L-glutamate ligase RimK-like protein